jgi:hypothetical protein
MNALRRLRASLTPPVVAALVAVIVASVGSATAATVITGKQIKNRSITAKDLSVATIKRLRGKAGRAGPRGAAGQPGAAGPRGLGGAAGSARAYARTRANETGTGTDTVDETHSKGITDANVTHPQTGVYCFYNLGFVPKNVAATEDYDDPANDAKDIQIGVSLATGDAFHPCGGNQAATIYVRNGGGTRFDQGLWVQFE